MTAAMLRAAPVPVVIVESGDDTIIEMNGLAIDRLGDAAVGRSLHDPNFALSTDGASQVLLDPATARRLVFLMPDDPRSQPRETANRLHDRAIPAAMAVGLRIELARSLAAPDAHAHLDHAAAILGELSTYLRDEMHLLAGKAPTSIPAPDAPVSPR